MILSFEKEKMSKCELCKFSTARLYCESDEARLCWDCDAKVHSANFLVGKHVRSLLCHSCQSITPWTRSGPKMGPTLSACDTCVRQNTRHRDHEVDENETEGDDGSDHNAEVDGDDDDSGDNQVVPLSSPSLQLPPASTSGHKDRETTSWWK